MLPALVAAVAPLPAEIVTDSGGDDLIAWRSYRACLTAACDADWLLVLQDDTVPCADFAARALEALEHATAPVAFFVPTTDFVDEPAFRQAQINREPSIALRIRDWIPVVALAWPTRMIPGFLEWADAQGYTAERLRADDAIVGEWAARTGVTVTATVPSIVEHPDVLPSLTGSRPPSGPARSAIAFAGT